VGKDIERPNIPDFDPPPLAPKNYYFKFTNNTSSNKEFKGVFNDKTP